MWSTTSLRSHMRVDGALCQQFFPALRCRYERECDDASWRDDHLNKWCVSVHRPGTSERAGTLIYCTTAASLLLDVPKRRRTLYSLTKDEMQNCQWLRSSAGRSNRVQ